MPVAEVYTWALGVRLYDTSSDRRPYRGLLIGLANHPSFDIVQVERCLSVFAGLEWLTIVLTERIQCALGLGVHAHCDAH
jgi:hypothetical protein